MPTALVRSGSSDEINRYKDSVLQAAAENDVAALRPFVDASGVAWDDVRNGERQHVLHVAAMEGANDVLEMLLSYPKVASMLDSRDRSNRSALHLAAAMGFEDTVRRLVAAKASLELKDIKGSTPLQLAVSFDWDDAARALIQLGADPMHQERLRGETVADFVRRKDRDMADSSAGSEARSTTWDDVRRCVFPCRGRRCDPWALNTAATAHHGRNGAHDRGCGVGALEVFDVRGGRPLRPQPGAGVGAQDAVSTGASSLCTDELCFAIAEAAGEDDGRVIEWHGLEAALVQKNKPVDVGTSPGASAASTTTGSSSESPAGSTPAESPVGSGHLVLQDKLACSSPVSMPSQASRGTPSASRGIAALPATNVHEAASGTPSSKKSALWSSMPSKLPSMKSVSIARPGGLVRLHISFDAQVAQLGFEVEWYAEAPVVGYVNPGGAAARRGLLKGDRIVEICGKHTAGRGRNELLPGLRSRPLLMTVDRRVSFTNAAADPYVELRIALSESVGDDGGLQVQRFIGLPVAVQVRPQSKAWSAGMREGDAIVLVGCRDVRESPAASVQAAIDNAATLTIWRRLLGADASAPWEA